MKCRVRIEQAGGKSTDGQRRNRTLDESILSVDTN